MSSLTFVTSLTNVSARLGEWEPLFQGSSKCGKLAPFCGPKVWLTWLEAHSDFQPLICENRTETGELVAGLALYRNGDSVFAAGDQHLDYQEIASRSAVHATELVTGIVDHCATNSLNLTLAKVVEDGPLFQALNSPEVAKQASIRGRYWSHCPVAKFSKSEGPDLFARLSKNRKKSHKTSCNRIRKAFPNHHVEHLNSGGISDEVIESISALHQRNQHRKSGASIFRQPAYREFLRRQREKNTDMVLSLIRKEAGGDLLAFILGFWDGQTYFYYIPSYEGEFAHLSPGRWLLVETLRHFYAETEGETFTFDMLSGSESYKKGWATEDYRIQRIQVIPKKLGNVPRLLTYSTVYGLKALKNRLRKVS